MAVRCGYVTIIQIIIDNFCVSWRKIVRRLWKTPYRNQNSLVHLINNCVSIDCILEKKMCNIFMEFIH